MRIILDAGRAPARRGGLSVLTAVLLAALLTALAPAARAQGAFIQIEANRSEEEGREAARRHGARVEGVVGYTAAGGWYVVALGPFEPEEARARLDRLRAEGRVPADAFLTEGRLYRERFWPTDRAAAADPAPAEEPVARAGEESVEEALASERGLDRAARAGLQEALEWAGFYDGAIDAAFGAGTRQAMAAWQGARGFEATGVLTTAQRAALRDEVEAVFDGLGMARVEDAEAGVSVEMPMAVLAFEGHETPFARYGATDGSDARVLLISQAGDGRALAGLYEVLQTLEIVPREGPRGIEGDAFRLRGRDARLDTEAFARLEDGEIKGMILAWPAGDEERRERLWERMRESFETRPGAVLGEAHATPLPEQRLDRLAGLALRTPRLARSGFFVGGDGAVATTAEVADGACGSILIDDAEVAEVAWSDDRLALLVPAAPLAPPRVARLAEGPGRLGSRVAVAGFPFGGALGRASLTFGRLEDIRGPEGDEALDRYALSAEAGDAGGPVLAADGSVAGLLLPSADGVGRALPPDVALGLDAGRLGEALREAGVAPRAHEGGDALPPERLARDAAEMTVLVTCYD